MKISADRVINHINGHKINKWFYDVEPGKFQNAVYITFGTTEILITSEGLDIKIFCQESKSGSWENLKSSGYWEETLSKVLLKSGFLDVQLSNDAQLVLLDGEVRQAITPIIPRNKERDCVYFPALLKTA